MKKGDIVLVPFPFTDLSSTKKRPAMVLVTTDEDVTLHKRNGKKSGMLI